MKYWLPILLLMPLFAQGQHSPYFYDYQRLDASIPQLSIVEEEGFGYGVEAIGDLDGDEVSEWLVISHSVDTVMCSVIFPDSAGNVLKVVKQAAPLWADFSPTPNGRLGRGMAAAGDINGDGLVDIWVGEPFGKEGPLQYGALWLWSVDQNGQLTAQHRWGGRSEEFLTRLTLEGQLGMDIQVLDDETLAVGAPASPRRGKGKIFLLSHAQGEALEILTVIGENDESEWWEEIRPNDGFAAGICIPGDLDGNGMPDLLVGAPGDNAAGKGKGALHLLYLDNSGNVIDHKKFTPGDPGMKLPLDAEDQFGSSLATIRPLNDSTSWIAVAAGKDDDGGKDVGAIYMLTVHQTGTIESWHKISETTYNFEGELGYRHNFATTISAAGDHNKDGRADLLVGGPGDQDQTGAAWLLMPTEWPERLKDTARWLGSFQLTAEDSALIFQNARTPEDSAEVLDTYQLGEYALNHLVLLLDVSASMKKPDRLPLLKQALLDLLPYMRPEDKLTIITYSGKPEVHIEAVPLEARDVITETLQRLTSSGETKPGKALKMALQIAEQHYIPGGNNRIIFGTDGGFEQEDIERALADITESRVTMSVFYFGKLPVNRISEMRIIAGQTGGNAAHISGNSARGALLRETKVIGRRE